MNVYLSKINFYLPEKILSNDDLSKDFLDWNSEKIFNKTGINERRIANDDETALDLSYKSSLPIVEYCNDNNLKIDFIIYISQTNDYLFPGNSTILMKKLGIRNIPCIDINLACSGFVYGLNLAYSLIESKQANNVVLVTSDTYSKIIHKLDKSVRTLFGDASASTLVSNQHLHNGLNLQLVDFLLGSDGDKFDSLFVRDGGFRNPLKSSSHIEKVDEKGYIRRDSDLFMNGEDILNFTLSIVPNNIVSLLSKNNLTLNDIKYFFFHQANKFILEYLGKTLNIKDKVLIDLKKTGNTTSSSIPILLSNTIQSLNITSGDLIMFSGFGVGLSWGSVILRKQ
jgi:3-oxoacyl-[acyl-carrier-protein] synthase-3